ncbi:internal scaffolding protein [robinz microvirus RP_120]|nr:internal scaffolding protein [robinz microvirus RP_120]
MRVQSGYFDDSDDMSSSYVLHAPVDVFFDEPSRTRQEFAAECDINTLMARYEKTGSMSGLLNERQPFYLDCTGLPDLQESLRIVKEAEIAFMSLPAVVRAEFDNDAVRWADYASDPSNLEQMRKWGLAPPAPEAPGPMKVEVVNASPPPPSDAT